MSLATGQERVAVFVAYHVLESGWVDEKIVGAEGGRRVSGRVSALINFQLAPCELEKISVPAPSATKILPPLKLKVPSPAFLMEKITEKTLASDPEKGVGVPPEKLIVPCTLSKVGSTGQIENSDSVFDTEDA